MLQVWQSVCVHPHYCVCSQLILRPFLPSSLPHIHKKKSLSLSLFLFSPSLPLLHFSTPSEDPLHSLSLFLPPFIFSSLSLLSLALPLPLPHLVSYLLCLPLLLSVDPLSLPVPSPQTPPPFFSPSPSPSWTLFSSHPLFLPL